MSGGHITIPTGFVTVIWGKHTGDGASITGHVSKLCSGVLTQGCEGPDTWSA